MGLRLFVLFTVLFAMIPDFMPAELEGGGVYPAKTWQRILHQSPGDTVRNTIISREPGFTYIYSEDATTDTEVMFRVSGEFALERDLAIGKRRVTQLEEPITIEGCRELPRPTPPFGEPELVIPPGISGVVTLDGNINRFFPLEIRNEGTGDLVIYDIFPWIQTDRFEMVAVDPPPFRMRPGEKRLVWFQMNVLDEEAFQQNIIREFPMIVYSSDFDQMELPATDDYERGGRGKLAPFFVDVSVYETVADIPDLLSIPPSAAPPAPCSDFNGDAIVDVADIVQHQFARRYIPHDIETRAQPSIERAPPGGVLCTNSSPVPNSQYEIGEDIRIALTEFLSVEETGYPIQNFLSVDNEWATYSHAETVKTTTTIQANIPFPFFMLRRQIIWSIDNIFYCYNYDSRVNGCMDTPLLGEEGADISITRSPESLDYGVVTTDGAVANFPNFTIENTGTAPLIVYDVFPLFSRQAFEMHPNDLPPYFLQPGERKVIYMNLTGDFSVFGSVKVETYPLVIHSNDPDDFSPPPEQEPIRGSDGEYSAFSVRNWHTYSTAESIPYYIDIPSPTPFIQACDDVDGNSIVNGEDVLFKLTN